MSYSCSSMAKSMNRGNCIEAASQRLLSIKRILSGVYVLTAASVFTNVLPPTAVLSQRPAKTSFTAHRITPSITWPLRMCDSVSNFREVWGFAESEIWRDGAGAHISHNAT